MRVSIFAAGLAVFASGFAWADMQAPHQRPGLWETSMTMMGHPYTTQSCVTEDSEAKMSVFSAQARRNNCSSNAITHNPDGSWTSTSVCTFGGGAARTSHAHVTGDMNSQFTVVVSVNDSKIPETTMTMKWLGACKPDMRGGDVVMSNGMKMNVLDGTMSGAPPH